MLQVKITKNIKNNDRTGIGINELKKQCKYFDAKKMAKYLEKKLYW